MTVYRPFPAAIVDLDRKVSRAIERGKGVTLSAEQLDVLTQIGILKNLAEAKAEILKEQAECRLKGSISEASSGSTMPAEKVGSPSAPISTSGGTHLKQASSDARARARATFG
jgi:hypothetical protein